MDLSKRVYIHTKLFPKDEIYGLTSQLRRAAVSIPSNIAEGYARNSRKEYIQFYSIAYGSVAELETQLILARDLDYISSDNFLETEKLLHEVAKMLHVLIIKLKQLNAKPS
jgi:four helix bundle protein